MAVEEYRDVDGEVRMLARLEPNDDHRKMRARMPSFTDWLRANGSDLIPRNKLVPVNRRAALGTEFINDQGQTSGCTCWSAAQMLMRQRALRGHQFQDLSGAFIYAHINGGRDAGSVITDSMKHLQNVGTCLRSEMDRPKLFMRDVTAQAKATAPRFRAGLCCTLHTFDEMLTAASMGYASEFPIRVSGGRFEQFTNSGIAGFTPGGGDHAVGADGLDFIDGQWVLDGFNTWRPTWGPFKNGRMYLSERAIESAGYPDDGYTLVEVLYDPQDPNLPPAPVL